MVDASAYLDVPKNWRPSEAEVFAIVEKDLLFQQKVRRVVWFIVMHNSHVVQVLHPA